MSLRSDLVSVVDAGRQLVDDLGFRQEAVVIRTRVWSGGKIGSGTATDTDLTISPRPVVGEPPPRLVGDVGGRYEAGDLIVKKISATYTEAQLSPSSTLGTEKLWILTDAGGAREFVAVGTPARLSFGYTVQLRRRTRV